ncbi:hypothetical protein AGMMS49983_17400 [Clostridia bacterium]|nr:hypothetical protein AGMMS49983_17400 [Clostridia bacterium]
MTIPFATSDSWTILSSIEQSIKRKIEAVGTPLRDWDVKINRGILTGCNEAFIITKQKREEILKKCETAEERERTVELIRPILRGRDIKKYGYEFADKWIILAEYNSHEWLLKKYPVVFEYLSQFEKKLRDRGQCRYTASGKPNKNTGAHFPGQHHWLELDNNPRRTYLDDFSKQKIIWGEISDKTKFAMDIEGKYCAEATTFLMTGNNLAYLLGFLNSSLMEYFFSTLGTTTGVGTIRWKKYKIEQLPIPQPTSLFQTLLTETVLEIIEVPLDSKDRYILEKKINSIVFQIVGLSEQEIRFIESQ